MSRTPKLDYSRVSIEQLNEFCRRAQALLEAEPGAYVTLIRIFDDRSEHTLARTPDGLESTVARWLSDQLPLVSEPTPWVRFRFRLWGAGGRAVGGVHVLIGYPEPKEVEPGPPEEPSADRALDEATSERLDALEQELAAFQGRLAGMQQMLTQSSLLLGEGASDGEQRPMSLVAWRKQVETALLSLTRQILILEKNQKILDKKLRRAG